MKKNSLYILILLILSLSITACQKEGNIEDQPREQEGKEEVKMEEEPLIINEDELVKVDELVRKEIKDLEGVSLVDVEVLSVKGKKEIDTIKLYLAYKEKDIKIAEEKIEKYSSKLERKIGEDISYKELDFFWETPNHIKDDIIEYIYYK